MNPQEDTLLQQVKARITSQNVVRTKDPTRGAAAVCSTIGFSWLANSSHNLVNIAKSEPGKHILLHQRAYIAEQLVLKTANPALTGVRTLLNLNRENQMEIDVELKCKKGSESSGD